MFFFALCYFVIFNIFQQFVWSEFFQDYRPTERRETFYPSVVHADRFYELKITDLPTIPYFPVSTHLEWTDFRYYGLRSATAYVLVFDLSNQDTFQVINYLLIIMLIKIIKLFYVFFGIDNNLIYRYCVITSH